jgi:hypothetical protein
MAYPASSEDLQRPLRLRSRLYAPLWERDAAPRMVSWLKPEVTTRQIDQICATFWLGTNQATGAPNGGYVRRAVDHRELPCRPGSRAVPRLQRAAMVTGGRLPGRRPRTGQAAAHSANTSRNGAGARPVLCYSRWVNITELVIFHRSEGSSPPSDTQIGGTSPFFEYRLSTRTAWLTAAASPRR